MSSIHWLWHMFKNVITKSVVNFQQNWDSIFKEPTPNEFLVEEEKEKQQKEIKEAARKKASLNVSLQLTLAESLLSSVSYKRESAHYKEIKRKLAIFIGTTNTPINIVEHTADQRYLVPSRSVVNKKLEAVLIEMKAKISSYLQHARRVSICTDIWLKRGLTSCYLGVTGHFYSPKDHCRHSVTLAVRRMPTTHTASNICCIVEEVLRRMADSSIQDFCYTYR